MDIINSDPWRQYSLILKERKALDAVRVGMIPKNEKVLRNDVPTTTNQNPLSTVCQTATRSSTARDCEITKKPR